MNDLTVSSQSCESWSRGLRALKIFGSSSCGTLAVLRLAASDVDAAAATPGVSQPELYLPRSGLAASIAWTAPLWLGGSFSTSSHSVGTSIERAPDESVTVV